MRTLLPLLLLSSLPALAAEYPAGATITDAAVIDITPEGFDAMADFVPALLPAEIELGEVGDGYEGAWGQCWLGGYEYKVSGLWVDLLVASTRLIPHKDVLELEVEMYVTINDSSDPFELFTSLECIDSTCDGHVEPFLTTVSTTVELVIVEGSDGLPVLDVKVGGDEGKVDVSYDLQGEDINLEDCAIGTIEDILNFVGLSIFDLVLDLAGGAVDDAIADLAPEIETALEDAFSAASIDQEVDLGETTLHVQLYPASVDIQEDGMRLGMDGSMTVPEVSDCVADWDTGFSTAISGASPDIGDYPSSVGQPHVAALLSDDIANQALYSLWRGGLLCYAITSEEAGIPLDTSLLGLLAGEAFDELFVEKAAMTINTRPQVPPSLAFPDDHDTAVHIEELGLDFHADLDHRQARIMGLDLAGDVGVDLALDSATGELAVGVDISGEALKALATHNEFAPDATEDIEANFASVFDTLVGSVVGGLLDDLGFALPAIEGLGLTDLDVEAAGPEADWLGIFVQVGPVTYEGAGCSADGGCESGCTGGGCSTNPVARGRTMLLLALPLLVVGLRRRG